MRLSSETNANVTPLVYVDAHRLAVFYEAFDIDWEYPFHNILVTVCELGSTLGQSSALTTYQAAVSKAFSILSTSALGFRLRRSTPCLSSSST